MTRFMLVSLDEEAMIKVFYFESLGRAMAIMDIIMKDGATQVTLCAVLDVQTYPGEEKE